MASTGNCRGVSLWPVILARGVSIAAFGPPLYWISREACGLARQGRETIAIMMSDVTMAPASAARRDRVVQMRAWLADHGIALTLAAVTAAGGAIRLATLTDKSLWIDETFSVGMATQGWESFWHTLGMVQPNMELFYFLLKLTVAITPAAWQHSEAFWRLLPALAGTGTIIAAFALARRIFDAPTALLAAAFVALDEFMVEYSQQARGYTLFALLLTLSYLALVRWLEGDPRALWWFAALSTLGFLTQAFEIVFLAGQIAWLALIAWHGRRIDWLRLTAALAPLAFVVALRYPLYAAHPDQVAWIVRPHWSDLVAGLRQLVGGDGGMGQIAAGNALLLLFLLACALLAVQVLRPHPSTRSPSSMESKLETTKPLGRAEAVALALLWFWVPVLGTWLGSQIKPLWVTRYLAPATITACIILAAGVTAAGEALRASDRRALVTGALALLVAGVLLVPLQDYLNRPGFEDWRGAAQAVEARFQPGDGVVCYDNQWGCDFGFSTYFAWQDGPAHLDAQAPGAFSWQVYSQPDREAIFAQAVNLAMLAPYLAWHGRMWVLLGHFTNGQGNWEAALAWLGSHAHLIYHVVARGDIRVYLFAQEGT
jgi:mannosyltransferase